MIRTIASVIRGEGLMSACRRAGERISEAVRPKFDAEADIVNVAPGGISPRNGGVAVQLAARLREERKLRPVAVRRDFAGAKAIHLEGTFGAPVDALIASRIPFVVSLHDTTLTDRRLLDAARGVIVPSSFLREFYAVDAEVIEPAVPAAERRVRVHEERRAIAYAGSVKRHKGAHLLPEIARVVDRLHVFGGGDLDLLQELRKLPNVVIHGYYRSGKLPALLARHRVGLVLLPSIVPESYSLTLSEAWMAGASVAAFDHGAPAERIRRDGGGWLAPPESGAAGLIAIIERWMSERPAPPAPRRAVSPAEAARAHVELYRKWGLL